MAFAGPRHPRNFAQLRIKLHLYPAAQWRFKHSMHMVVFRPGGQFEVIRRLARFWGPRLLGHRLQRMSVSDCEFARRQAKPSTRWGSGGPQDNSEEVHPKTDMTTYHEKISASQFH